METGFVVTPTIRLMFPEIVLFWHSKITLKNEEQELQHRIDTTFTGWIS